MVGVCRGTVGLEGEQHHSPDTYFYYGRTGQIITDIEEDYADDAAFGAGDVVGVELHFLQNGFAYLSFIKNGRHLGIAFYDLPPGLWFPCISLHYEHDSVRISGEYIMALSALFPMSLPLMDDIQLQRENRRLTVWT